MTYTVKKGETLWGIAEKLLGSGSRWKELGYTGDPKKLQIGTVLTYGEKKLPEDDTTLGHTLPPENGTKEKTFPIGQLDQLTLMRLALRDVSKAAQAKGISTGLTETFGAFKGMGIEPERVSGDLTSRIISLVESRVREPITETFETMDMMITSIDARRRELKSNSRSAISQAVSAGWWNTMSQDQRNDLWADAGYTGEPPLVPEKVDTTKLTDADRITELNKFLSEKITDGVVPAKDYIAAYKEWIGLGGTISDFKYAYPVEEWVSKEEYTSLPSGWRPKAEPEVEDIKNLPADQQIFIKQVQGKIDTYELTYDEAIEKYPQIAVYLNPAK